MKRLALFFSAAVLTACGQAGPLVRPSDIPRPAPAPAETPTSEKSAEATVPAAPAVPAP